MKNQILAALAVVLFSASFSPAAIIVNADVTAPADAIVGVASTAGNNVSTAATIGTTANTNNYPAAEPPTAATDNITGGGNKYLNFLKTGSGFIVTASTNGPQTIIDGVRFFSGNDAPERDPFAITIEGTNDPNATTTLNSAWSLIYSGPSGLLVDPGRDAFGSQVNFANLSAYSSYRVLITGVRNAGAANSFQFGEIELIGSTAAVPEPSSLVLMGIGAIGLLVMRRRRK